MKYTITFLFMIISLFINVFINSIVAAPPVNHSYKKLKAFEVLEKKCNACHLKDKKNYFFTLDNMDGFAKKINKQVFIKKKMPKGVENNLTNKEEQILKTWVESELAKK